MRRELGDARPRIGQLERLVDEDPLTPIANRRAFMRELVAHDRLHPTLRPAVERRLFRINGMKQINDTHGHAAGDAALRPSRGDPAQERAVERFRRPPRRRRVRRHPGADQSGRAKRKAVALAQESWRSRCVWQGQPIPVTAAYGVYSFSGSEIPTTIEAADKAMYRSKRA